MPRALRYLLPLLLLGAAGGGLYWYLQTPESGQNGPITLYGDVDIREAELAFPLSARIARVPVEEGDRVKAGDLLAVLDRERLRQAAAEARGRMEAAKAELEALEAGSRPAEIRRARAETEAAEATANLARQALERLRNLADERFVPQQRLDDAEAELAASRARLRAARQSLALLEEGPRKEDIRAARARSRATEAEYRRRRKELADARLQAPAAGIIRNRLMEPGEVATPQTPVLTLARRDRIWVRAFLPEPQLGRVRPGMAAEIHTDTYPDRSFPARVGHISPTAEFTPKTVETTEIRPELVYRTRINACKPYPELRLGMPVTVVIRPEVAGKRAEPCP
ncbi:efflux RND transporter periplasmic adaptor subunit [Thiohalorhabdus methylotrophus]|uniref:Efflux RND transporter periplasmic adaptor subunit n=1 Tax=Thiohalorhabdus methylotrophus TaxID=3242694 RepID=A0ABV4TUD9_9GAMM